MFRKSLFVKALTILILCAVTAASSSCGLFVDRTAFVGTGENSRVEWRGKTYIPASGPHTLDKIIGASEDYGWTIHSVKQDPSKTFIVAASLRDSYFFVDSEYQIPTGGSITKASWGAAYSGSYTNDEKILTALRELKEKIKTDFVKNETYEEYYKISSDHKIKELWVGYEDCPIATEKLGYMGKLDGRWVITTYVNVTGTDEKGYPLGYETGCYLIPDEYIDTIIEFANAVNFD